MICNEMFKYLIWAYINIFVSVLPVSDMTEEQIHRQRFFFLLSSWSNVCVSSQDENKSSSPPRTRPRQDLWGMHKLGSDETQTCNCFHHAETARMIQAKILSPSRKCLRPLEFGRVNLHNGKDFDHAEIISVYYITSWLFLLTFWSVTDHVGKLSSFAALWWTNPCDLTPLKQW